MKLFKTTINGKLAQIRTVSFPNENRSVSFIRSGFKWAAFTLGGKLFDNEQHIKGVGILKLTDSYDTSKHWELIDQINMASSQ